MPENPSAWKSRIVAAVARRFCAAASRTSCPSIFLSLTQLETGNSRIDTVYFIDRGFASVVADGPGKRDIEVGLIGREGMTGLAVVLGQRSRAAITTYMQAAGAGQRISAAKLRSAIDQSVRLHRSLLRCVHAFLIQTTQTALANGRSKNEERLARWLLMADDRLDGRRAAAHPQVSRHHAWRAAAGCDRRGASSRA